MKIGVHKILANIATPLSRAVNIMQVTHFS